MRRRTLAKCHSCFTRNCLSPSSEARILTANGALLCECAYKFPTGEQIEMYCGLMLCKRTIGGVVLARRRFKTAIPLLTSGCHQLLIISSKACPREKCVAAPTLHVHPQRVSRKDPQPSTKLNVCC